jgi:hypothetical protein
MLTSNPQLEGQIRTLVMFFGGLAVGYGWLTQHDLNALLAIVAGLVPVAGMVWSWWVNRPAALVQAAAALPVVEKIKLDESAPGAVAINQETGRKVTIT